MLLFVTLMASTVLIPLAIGVLYFRRLPVYAKIFTVLMFIGAATETSMYLTASAGIRNLFIMHVYTILELLLLAAFFHEVTRDRVWRTYIVYAVPIIVSAAVIYAGLGQNLYDFNSLPKAIECLYMISLGAWIFYESQTGEDPARQGTFYITGGLLFYFCSSMIIFGFSRLAEQTDYLMPMFLAHSVVNAISKLTFAAGLWISSRYSYSVQ